MKDKILVTGAGGQLGIELTKALVDLYGAGAVIASDINSGAKERFDFCHFTGLDVLDARNLHRVVSENKVTQIYHLAAMLSAVGESNPLGTWHLNVQGLINVLELARYLSMDKVFWPSSIAVFGNKAPKVSTPQESILNPSTVYGMTKVAGEFWCGFYFRNYGVDVRSVRYPGLIGYKSPPGGGTTDYAVEIFHKAVAQEPFKCFLKADTFLPMMYMPDALKATLELMQAPRENISVRSSYNISGMSFTPSWLHQSICKKLPGFKVIHEPDFRQGIAETWPVSIDDNQARNDWGWTPDYDLDTMSEDMIRHLKHHHKT
jgi:nucleoside-diphosphate-sugar epimerase